jgi:predicted dienelactone hydrolase
VAAASPESFIARVQDVGAVLDWLERSREPDHPLRGRLDMTRVGMSGHSFGAITTQAVSGQRFPGGAVAPDSRIKAALPMSPSPPQRGDAATAFRSVRIPWLVMTGTLDSSPIGNTGAAARREVFASLPPSFKYELVLDRAEHSAFTDRALPGDRSPRNPNHHRAILAISTAFWDAYLRQDQAARAWLDGSGPRSVLQPRDIWQRK